MNEITIAKNGHLFIFRYEHGDEGHAMSEVIDTVGVCGFDHFDAQLAAHRIGTLCAENRRACRRIPSALAFLRSSHAERTLKCQP